MSTESEPSGDLKRRWIRHALDRYRAWAEPGTEEPRQSDLVKEGSHWYVILRGKYEVVAVYRARGNGVELDRVSALPDSLRSAHPGNKEDL